MKGAEQKADKKADKKADSRELKDALAKLLKNEPPYEEIQYFIKEVENYFSEEGTAGPEHKVIVLGTSVPEEFIYASGTSPNWILGGSLEMGQWADDELPRDTDPVSRSIFGHLLKQLSLCGSDSLIVIPVVGDSSRKMAYLLRRAGKKVHTIDIPPVKDRFAIRKWDLQLELFGEALSRHTGKRITKQSLQEASDKVAYARIQMQQFLKASNGRLGELEGSYRMFLLGSYYCSDDITEWSRNMHQLNVRLTKLPMRQTEQTDRNNVLLMGSPIYFPNFKIPFLLQEVGMNLCANVDYTIQKSFTSPASWKKRKVDFYRLFHRFYKKDCSSAYIQNRAMLDSIVRLIGEKQIDGVVYHVLKGQIEYDFELEWFEQLFSKYEIPVFRLETDYNYQDIEQLRIRMEAFMEVLTQRKYSRKAAAL